ncbi:MAG TPA: hypothetical protein VLS45_09250, partial [Methylomicrobium sp.]|nr:hypothetical protein [Methylomicrobium sp.]
KYLSPPAPDFSGARQSDKFARVFLFPSISFRNGGTFTAIHLFQLDLDAMSKFGGNQYPQADHHPDLAAAH